MFYKMITAKRDKWYANPDCTVRSVISYIEEKGQMRDAQTDAIKTWLFLKIACGNKPLYELLKGGAFNNIDLNGIEFKSSVRDYLDGHPASAALFEYASMKDEKGAVLAPKVASRIKEAPESIDYDAVFRKIFYGVSYTDYLFSLPMGAGKTFLMAAFIYLDLYFAQNEPDNDVFTHNFVIFAPSGLKSSVVPSLRTIQRFDPSWVIPEPAASKLKRLLLFEVLDQAKTSKKSNRTKNPNVQKIALHQPLERLFGLVAVTNAEKVILDGITEKDRQLNLFGESDDDCDRQSNELRNLIGKLPRLSVFIDEVHHAATDDKKLRAVVNKWTANGGVNSVIGFSGTPYLPKKEKTAITHDLNIASTEISNIVYYYPLVDGIGNFLKKPIVKISSAADRHSIVESGIREFLDKYKDTIYSDGTSAKLGIYCGGNIQTLEEEVYPLAERIISGYGLNPSEAILKFHGGNKKYPAPAESEMEFLSLDKPFSKIRIILLVQIGKEGWDCRSLTGIILASENDCPTNMVLQTSCRCLRQVQKGSPESALIYLNSGNAATLNMQLKQQHHITMQEFQNGADIPFVTISRYDRTKYLKLPKIGFFQLRINYRTILEKTARDIGESILHSADNVRTSAVVEEAEFANGLSVTDIRTENGEKGREPADFQIWLYTIAKQSFGGVTMPMLLENEKTLLAIFEKITYWNDGILYFSSKYDTDEVNANIRRAFCSRRSFETEEELVPEESSLLKIGNFTPRVEVKCTEKADFYPDTDIVEKIMRGDKGEYAADAKTEAAIKALESIGQTAMAKELRRKISPYPMKDSSFHYLPYRTDSRFEQQFLSEVLKLSLVKERRVEVYYNGDRALTEFRIKCYKKGKNGWHYIGMYTPDFLMIHRKDGKIYKAVIVETKGEIYADDPAFQDKRAFMDSVFTSRNNMEYGYDRFTYLYLEDSMDEVERINKTSDTIKKFFEEDSGNDD